MTPFTTHSGRAAVLPIDNVDTDQIIPARFLRKPRSAGYGNFLFYDMRFDRDGRPAEDFPLHRDPEASILVAGDNFGCGSSREGAVYALVDFGVRVVVATSVADIFRNNAVRNGLLPVVLDASEHEALARAVEADPALEVDLEARTIRHATLGALAFDIDEPSRRRLLEGRDDIADTAAHLDEIERFETRYRDAAPWRWPAAPGAEAGSDAR
jgi:3-isopropylmalate/(R)-2-methylmalate dehydratase small subunit